MRSLTGILALAIATATTATAQAPIAPVPVCTSEYIVQPGDRLWSLAQLKLGDPARWEWLVEQNPVLQQKGRVLTDSSGNEIAFIYPGEKLYCLDEVGYNLQKAAFDQAFTKELKQSTTAEKITVTGADRDWSFVTDWWWLWPLLAVAVLLCLYRIWTYYESRKDPVTSGHPQVWGGIDSAAEAHQQFASRNPAFAILRTVPGRIYGTMNVRYGDGTERPRIHNGQRAFQATVRQQNGGIRSLYMLQECGNDLRFGEVTGYQPGRNFRFVPDAAEQSDVQSATSVSEPTTEETTVDTEVEGELKIELKPATEPGGTALVRVTGAPTTDMTITVTDESMTLRYRKSE